ncbi:MAG: hypothetical protein K2Z81_12645 [Cyanobacteria bacterium]|nr:hypothetical protein [Cyanobacteriota bacterium]
MYYENQFEDYSAQSQNVGDCSSLLLEDAYPFMCSSESAVTDPVEAALQTLASANITRDGTSVRGTLPGRQTIDINQNGVDRIRFQANLSCNATCNDNSITLSNIRGIDVDPGTLSPWLDVTRIQVDRNRAVVTVSRFGGNFDISVDLGEGDFDNIRNTLRRSNIIP